MCRRKVSRSPSTLRNRVVMFYQLFYQFFGVASIALATACGRQADKVVVSDSGGAGAVAPTQAPLVPMRDTVGSGSINWTLVDFEKRMRGAGVEAIAAGEVRQPFLRAPGMSFHLRGGELQAYIYGDAGALSGRISTDTTNRQTQKALASSDELEASRDREERVMIRLLGEGVLGVPHHLPRAPLRVRATEESTEQP